jgi:hypothetical protein
VDQGRDIVSLLERISVVELHDPWRVFFAAVRTRSALQVRDQAFVFFTLFADPLYPRRTPNFSMAILVVGVPRIRLNAHARLALSDAQASDSIPKAELLVGLDLLALATLSQSTYGDKVVHT